MTLSEAQQKVDEWIKTTGVRYFSELTNMAILTEEVGEVARLMSRQYGDQSFKDALAAADVPAKVTWLAYADIQRLAPILQALASLSGNGQAKPATTGKLDKFQTLVAFGTRSGSTSRVEARLTLR